MAVKRALGRLGGSAATVALAVFTGTMLAGTARAEDPSSALVATAETADASADAGGGDIIVTARRRKEAVQDVPIAVSVVSADALEKAGDYTISQVQQLVPSLQVTATNPRNSVVNIRGLGANSSIAVDGLEYGVGFYIDGVYYARPGQSQFDLIDLQQIEVLRGPQGTLFGKNTTAGAVNITTRLPSFTPELTGEASFGDYDYRQFRASVSTALIAGKLAFRLTAASTHRGGYLTNAYDGSDAQNYKNTTVRGQLLAKPTETLTIRLIGDYSRQRQHYSLTLVDGYYTTYANGATIANNIFDRAARTGYTLPAPNAFLRVGNADAPFHANMASYGASGQADLDLGATTLTSITAYRWWDWNPANDVDGTSLPINTKGQLADRQRQFSQELRIASDGTHKIDYVAGVYYFWQVIRGYGQTGYGSAFTAWNFNPATTPAGTIALANLATQNFEADSTSNPQTRSYAAFGQSDWHITDKLTFTGGLRYTHEDKQGSFSQFWVSGVDPATLPAATAAGVIALRNSFSPILNFSAKLHANAVTGLATLSYKVWSDGLLYATYSRGNKSGGLNLTAGGAIQPVVNPEKVNAYEIGLKSQFLDRRLTANFAAFQTEITDYQTSVTNFVGSTTSTIQYIANIPKVRSRGLEGDLAFAPVHWASFTAAAAYTDARYISYNNASQAPEAINTGAVQDLSGGRLPNVPKFTYTLGADISQPLAQTAALGELRGYGHVDFAHRSSFNSTATNSVYGIVPAYGLVNGRIGITARDGRYDVSLWVRNLANTNYYITRSPANYGLISASVGEPRSFGATLRTKL